MPFESSSLQAHAVSAMFDPWHYIKNKDEKDARNRFRVQRGAPNTKPGSHSIPETYGSNGSHR